MMRLPILKKFTWLTLPLGLALAAPAYTIAQAVWTQEQPTIRRPIPEEARNRTVGFRRTELFFGTARPGGVVTEEQFRLFVDQEVTPRFPAGLTVIEADGQFTGADGALVKEDSFVIVLLYANEATTKSHRRIETIRRRYMTRFQQESVLRVDDPFGVWVSF